MSSDYEKAKAMVKRADAARGRNKFMAFLSGGGKEEAAEIYQEAANLFKISSHWEEAGNAFRSSADCNLQTDSPHEAVANLMDAAKCLKKSGSSTALATLSELIELMKKIGNFQSAARTMRELAEAYEAENNAEKAREFYEQAADVFEGEEQPQQANQCKAKVADMCASSGEYSRAIDLFENLGHIAARSGVQKLAARENFFKAALCRLAHVPVSQSGVEAIMDDLNRYADVDPHFAGSNEQKLLASLADALHARDEDAFEKAVYEFERRAKLDTLKRKLLEKVKETGLAADVL